MVLGTLAASMRSRRSGRLAHEPRRSTGTAASSTRALERSGRSRTVELDGAPARSTTPATAHWLTSWTNTGRLDHSPIDSLPFDADAAGDPFRQSTAYQVFLTSDTSGNRSISSRADAPSRRSAMPSGAWHVGVDRSINIRHSRPALLTRDVRHPVVPYADRHEKSTSDLSQPGPISLAASPSSILASAAVRASATPEWVNS